MKNKIAISLIVLVITIIIMAILAATVVITLSNTNIISKANRTVSDSNVAQMKELASITKANYMLENGGNASGCGEKVKKAIEDSMNLNEEQLTKQGIYITYDGDVLDLREEEAQATYYYSTLYNAVNAVNNSDSTALVSDSGVSLDNANVSVSKGITGKYTVKVLHDLEITNASENLIVTKSMTIDLNDKNVLFNTGTAGIKIRINNENADVIVKGREKGTLKLIYEGSDSNGAVILINKCNSFTMVGGEYEAQVAGQVGTIFLNPANTGKVGIYNAKISGISTSNTASVDQMWLRTAIRIQGTGDTTVENCKVSFAGKNEAKGIIVINEGKVTLNNNTVLASAAYADANMYSDTQTCAIALFSSGDNMEVYGGFYSGELMAASIRGNNTKINGATFESCDHGMYFSSEKTTVKNSNFIFKNWSELECAKLTFPESVIAGGKKTQYSEKNKDYANQAVFYIGTPDNESTVYMDNCKIIGAKGVLSANYEHLNTYLYVSNTNFVNGLRIDKNATTGYMGRVYMGKGATCPSDQITGDGVYDTTTYANTTF